MTHMDQGITELSWFTHMIQCALIKEQQTYNHKYHCLFQEKVFISMIGSSHLLQDKAVTGLSLVTESLALLR